MAFIGASTAQNLLISLHLSTITRVGIIFAKRITMKIVYVNVARPIKTVSMLIGTAILMSFSVQAQKKQQVPVALPLEVPQPVHVSFMNRFADSSIARWKKTYRGNFIAEFTNAVSQELSVEYDPNGMLLKTKTRYHVDALPPQISQTLVANQPEAKVEECIKVDIAGIRPYYKVKLTDINNTQKNLLISEEGTISE